MDSSASPQAELTIFPARSGAHSARAMGSAVVLDTQIVLDWMVFGDPRVRRLVADIEQGALHWFATAAMWEECLHVAGRPTLSAWKPNAARLASLWAQWAHGVAAATAAPRGLRCRDPDDQMFVELALAVKARYLFSRDKAVLALSKPLALHGVQVLRPADWRPEKAFGG
jgi:predicted nucleic acid-binding protein